MGTFGEYIKSALASIRNNKVRSFLTMLGIIIGISAVLVVLIIGDGMKATVNDTIDTMGPTTVNVALDTNKTDRHVTKENLDDIDEALKDLIYGSSPTFSVYGTLLGRKKDFDIGLNGGGEATGAGGAVKMVHGRYYNSSDVDERKKVIVVSQSFANLVFGYEEVVGETVDVNAQNITDTFSIIGVREDNPRDKAYASFGDSATVLCDLPYTTLGNSFDYDVDHIFTSITLYLDSENKNAVLLKARSVVENVLGLRGENCVKITSNAGYDQTTDTIMNIITSVIAIIAAISLLVGGIGVMNIMTVSVTERTREIGIRKSLGARTASILTQFLAEAAILTFTGGIIGIILGVSISFIICKVIDFAFIVNPVLIVIVVAISTGIGLFFGIYPARRAAKLDPIEALRTE